MVKTFKSKNEAQPVQIVGHRVRQSTAADGRLGIGALSMDVCYTKNGSNMELLSRANLSDWIRSG